MLAAAAIALLAGQYWLIAAMRTGEIAVVAPFRYSLIVWAIASGYIVWGEVPDLAVLDRHRHRLAGRALHVPARAASGADGESDMSANLRGILAVLVASTAFVLNDALVKLVSAELPPSEIIVVRGILATLMLIAGVCGARRRPPHLHPVRRR